MKTAALSSATARRQDSEGVSALRLPGAARRALWLIGADLCVFTRIDMHAVAPRHRARAIAERARQLSPFAHSGWHSADLDGSMALWCWDAARVSAAMEQESGTASNWEILPEQIFVEPAQGGCLRQSGGADVLECWRDGKLAFSATLPDEASQRALRLRSAGLAVDAEPARLPTRLLASRWDQPELAWRELLREPMTAGLALLAGCALWLLWSLGMLAGQGFANQRLEQSLAAQQEALAPLLAEREQALQLAGRNQALAALLGQVSALEAAAEFEFLVGGQYQRLLSWQLNGSLLRATLEDPTPDNRAYVEALQGSPWFDRVSVSPSVRPDQINLEIQLGNTGAAPLYLGSKGERP
jgi:hypothetical protein